MVHTCNLNSQEAKVFQVQGQPEIHSKILSLKKKNKQYFDGVPLGVIFRNKISCQKKYFLLY
jgi:hypothetical protein